MQARKRRGARSTAEAAKSTASAPRDLVLDFDPAKITTTDATVAGQTRPGAGPARGHRPPASWPGIALPAPRGHWDLSPFGQVALESRTQAPRRRSIAAWIIPAPTA